MYVVIETGAKQYLLNKDEVIRIEKLPNEIGEDVEFDKVLMLKDNDGNVKIGAPYLSNVKAIGKVLRQDRDKKIIVFKKKRRKSYTKTKGHRQYFSEVKITDIQVN